METKGSESLNDSDPFDSRAGAPHPARDGLLDEIDDHRARIGSVVSSASANPSAARTTRSFSAPVQRGARFFGEDMPSTLRACRSHRESVSWDTPTVSANLFALTAGGPINRCTTHATTILTQGAGGGWRQSDARETRSQAPPAHLVPFEKSLRHDHNLNGTAAADDKTAACAETTNSPLAAGSCQCSVKVFSLQFEFSVLSATDVAYSRRYGTRRGTFRLTPHDLRLTSGLEQRVHLRQLRRDHALQPRELPVGLGRQYVPHVIRLLRRTTLAARDKAHQPAQLIVEANGEVAWVLPRLVLRLVQRVFHREQRIGKALRHRRAFNDSDPFDSLATETSPSRQRAVGAQWGFARGHPVGGGASSGRMDSMMAMSDSWATLVGASASRT